MPVKQMLLLTMLWGFFGCGNPGEQDANRQKLLDGLNDHKVKRVTEDQVHAAAYHQGNSIIEEINATGMPNWQSPEGTAILDSISEALGHGGLKLISEITPLSNIGADERALMEAYQYSHEQGQPIRENVQSIPGDYLLYTVPVVKEEMLFGMWSLLLSKKTLIRNL